jgi:hypothetical protein
MGCGVEHLAQRFQHRAFRENVPVGLKQNAAGEEAPALIVLAIRRVMGALPWGEGPGQLPYTHSEMGCTEAAAPSRMVPVRPPCFFLNDPSRGSVYAADMAKKTVRPVDLRRTCGDALGGAPATALAAARTPAREVAVLVRGQPEDAGPFRYALCFTLDGSEARRCLALPELARIKETPTGLGVSEDGTIWILYPTEAVVLDADGHRLQVIDAAGILTPACRYITNEEQPRLFTPHGEEGGTIEVSGATPPISLLAAGRDGLLLAACTTEAIPETLYDALDLYDIYRFDGEASLELHDRIAVPAMTVVPAPPGELEDALPVKSYFPAESLACDPAGNVWILEHTSRECRLHVFRRLRGGPETWKDKFARLEDLSTAELALYTAECRCRLGSTEAAGALAEASTSMAWRQHRLPPEDPQARAGLEAALRSLETTPPARE